MRQRQVISTLMVVLLLGMIIAVRYFELLFFYDPLDTYFKGNFHAYSFPKMDLWKLVLSNSLRFAANSVLSLGVLWFLYKSISFIKAGFWVYVFAFTILTTALLILLQFESSLAKMALFYTRRFLIHPFLLFILVAGCYYLKNKAREL